MTIAAFVVSALALGLSALAFLKSVESKRHDLFMSFWQRYSSNEMLEALLAFYRFWDDCRDKPEDWIKEQYRRRMAAGEPLHQQRRIVSHFFQHLAFAYSEHLLPRKYREHWFGFSLDPIAFLHTIETKVLYGMFAERKLPDELPLDQSSEDFRRMFTLYNEWRKSNRRRDHKKPGRRA